MLTDKNANIQSAARSRRTTPAQDPIERSVAWRLVGWRASAARPSTSSEADGRGRDRDAGSPTRGYRRDHRPRRTPSRWVRGGGLSTLLFLLPLLFVFGAFSWYPIVRTVDHVVPAHEPRAGADLGRARQLPRRLARPAARRSRSRTPPYFALLALIFGYPIPLVAAVLMSEVRQRRGLYSALAYLPVVIPPVVAVLLWKTFYDASSTGVFNTDPRLGRPRARTRGCSREHGRCRRSCSSRPGRTRARR